MDVAAWLRGLGLAQYAPAFRDNDIGVVVSGSPHGIGELPQADDVLGLFEPLVARKRRSVSKLPRCLSWFIRDVISLSGIVENFSLWLRSAAWFGQCSPRGQ